MSFIIRSFSIFCFLFIFLSIPKNGLAQDFKLNHWTIKNGLSNTVVTDIASTNDGMIWIGTQHGLNSFNGYDFTTFRKDFDDEFSIGDDEITGLYTDPVNYLWVKLKNGGLARYNKNEKNFTNFHFNSSIAQTSKLCAASPRGDLLISQNDQLFFIPHLNDDFKLIKNELGTEGMAPKYLVNLTDEKFLLAYVNQFLLFDVTSQSTQEFSIPGLPNGNDVIVKEIQGKIYLLSKLKLWELNKETLTTSLLHKCTKEADSFADFLVDSNGEKWVVYEHAGLYSIDRSKEVLEKYPELKNIKTAIPDNTEGLWGMDGAGKIYYLNQMGISYPLQSKALPLGKIKITSLLGGEFNSLWIGTYGQGICRIFMETHQLGKMYAIEMAASKGQIDPFITAIAELPNHSIAVGTKNGLRIFNPKKQMVFSFSEIYKKTHPILKDEFILSLKWAKNHLWILTETQLIKTDLKDIFEVQITPKKKIKPEKNRLLYVDNQERLFLLKEESVWMFDEENEDLMPLAFPDSFRFQPTTLIQLTSSEYWLGTYNNGPLKFSLSEGFRPKIEDSSLFSTQAKPQANYTITQFFENQKGQLFAGCNSIGLLRYDTENKTFDPVKNRKNLPSVNGILEDELGALWLSSNNGLHKYLPEGGQWKKYEDYDGLQSKQFNQNAFTKLENGKLVFGGVNGINCFFAEKIENAPPVPTPIITSFKVFGKDLLYDKTIQEQEEIVLHYNDNYVTIEFASVNFDNPESVIYEYKLEGFDENWMVAPSNRMVSYENLPCGPFEFKLKAGNEESQWQAAQTQFAIYITPPFWRRNWFYVLMVILISGLIYGIMQYQLKVELDKIEEVEKVREKAALDFHDELGHRLTKISLFAEMISRSKPGLEKNALSNLNKIKENSHELYHSMRDFIWAMNPKNDALLEMGIMLKDFGDELFDNTGIVFLVQGMEQLPEDKFLDMDWKRHLVLIFKEAMHNALKHSECSIVEISFGFDTVDNVLSIRLRDDGKGFENAAGKQGYGLGNMRVRTEKLGGTIEIESKDGLGTHVFFKGKISQK